MASLDLEEESLEEGLAPDLDDKLTDQAQSELNQECIQFLDEEPWIDDEIVDSF